MSNSGTLYTPANYHKAYRCLLAAKYSGAKVTVADYLPGVTEKGLGAEFPPNECPLFVSTNGKNKMFEANAIAHFLGNEQLRGGKNEKDVIQWTSFTDSVLLPSVGTWVYPTLGIKELKKGNSQKAKENITKFMEFFNSYLSKVTYLVGDCITQADLTVFTAINLLFSTVFKEAERKPYPHVSRWFNTIANQPNVVAVCGQPSAAPASKKQETKKEAPAKKEEPKKEKKEEPKQEEEAPKKKENKLAALPAGTLNLEEWKREFSNNDFDKVAFPWFLKKFDAENYSIWYCKYKFPEQLNMIFQSKNLIKGFYQRMEAATKYVFAGMWVFGESKKSEISGVWLWRGTGMIFDLSEDLQIDYESYDWKKLDLSKPEDQKVIRDHWVGEGTYHGKECNDGAIFK